MTLFCPSCGWEPDDLRDDAPVSTVPWSAGELCPDCYTGRLERRRQRVRR